MTESHAAVQHCPYCAGTDLHPHDSAGGWACRGCRRAFSVRLLGLLRPPATGVPTEEHA